MPGAQVTRPLRGLHWAALIALLLAGAALRWHQPAAVPPGLYQDEAYNGLDALSVVGGARPIYFSANNGREPLFIYLVAASVAVLGRTALAVRLPAMLAGVLLLPATYALGRALFGRRAGLLAMGVAAFTFWPVALSRIGLRAGVLPVLSALWLALAASGLRLGWPRGRGRLAAAGLVWGLSFYTYLAVRFTPLALMCFLVFWYIAQRHTFPTVRQGVVFWAAAGLTVLPLGLAAAGQPEILSGRAGQVSILSPGVNHGDLWGTLFHNLFAALGMFTQRGDAIARHNLPGRPVFDIVLGLLFWAGVAWAAWQALRRRRLAPALLLAWTGVMLLPTVLAEDAPHFLRAVGVLPVALLFPAVALDRLWAYASRRLLGWRRALPAALSAAVLVVSAAVTARDYFGRYAADPATGYLFQSAAAELARSGNRYLAEVPGGDLYLDRRFWDDFASVRFLLEPSARLHVFDEGQPLAPPPGARARVIIWPYEAVRPVLAALPAGSLITPEAGPLYRGDLEAAPYALYAAYTVGGPCPSPHCEAPAASFGAGRELELLAAAVVPVPGGAQLELVWQAGPAPDRAWQVFAHVVVDGEVADQADGPLGTDLYPSQWWRAGERVLETRRLRWSADPGSLIQIEIGIYDPATQVRLPRADGPGDKLVIVP